MKKIDYTSVDGQLLRTFLLVLEESSVSAAAARLGVTQSTVSHSLARLRSFFGDPLFVRSGQSMMATERAISLKPAVQEAIDSLKSLTHQRAFDPQKEDMFFIVAANDMQRDLIFPQLLRDLHEEGISAAFEMIPSGHPTPAMLREEHCHLALTPFPPNATDIVQKAVLEGPMMCFFDGTMRGPPASWEEYCQADHLTVRFPDGGTSMRALTGVDKSQIRDARVSVPNFSSLPAFLKGTRYLVTQMGFMKATAFSEFDVAPLPRPADNVKIYMVWHQRSTSDPAHSWLRARVSDLAAAVQGRADI